MAVVTVVAIVAVAMTAGDDEWWGNDNSGIHYGEMKWSKIKRIIVFFFLEDGKKKLKFLARTKLPKESTFQHF